jgi:ribonuclease Z
VRFYFHFEIWVMTQILYRFSGDTMPSNNLIQEGQSATLLIHEATMADNQAEMARLKGHSTFGQAVQIGKR